MAQTSRRVLCDFAAAALIVLETHRLPRWSSTRQTQTSGLRALTERSATRNTPRCHRASVVSKRIASKTQDINTTQRCNARDCWAEAREKIAGMTLTIKPDWNWSSFQLANSTPPLSVTGSATAPSARMHCKARKPNLCATSCDLSQAPCVSQRHTNATTRPIKQTPTQDSTAASKWLGAGATTTPQICSTAHSCYPSHIFHCGVHDIITLRGNTY